MNGNGCPGYGVDVSDFDNRKDIIAHLSTEQSFRDGKFLIGGGVSYYDGGFRIDSVNVYSMGDSAGVIGYHLDSKNIDNGALKYGERSFTERKYMGVDIHCTFKWKAGSTTLRAEYISGSQPGISSSSKSPNDKTPISKDIYNRDFSGAYFYEVGRAHV